MDKSEIKALAENVFSKYYRLAEIAAQDPNAIAIELLKLSTEEAKIFLESIYLSDQREKIHTNLILLSQKIQVLLEC